MVLLNADQDIALGGIGTASWRLMTSTAFLNVCGDQQPGSMRDEGCIEGPRNREKILWWLVKTIEEGRSGAECKRRNERERDAMNTKQCGCIQ